MPTTTYTPLANITLGSSASSVTFSNIPSTYRDLILVHQGTADSAVQSLSLRFNSDTGSNYSGVYMDGYGSSTASGTISGTGINLGIVSAGSRSQNIIQIMDSSATDKHKTVLFRSGATDWGTRAGAARWANTSAITSVGVFCSSSFTSGTTFALYGVIA